MTVGDIERSLASSSCQSVQVFHEGRLRGQGFATFRSVLDAARGLAAIHGCVLFGKAVIASYSRPRGGQSRPSQEVHWGIE